MSEPAVPLFVRVLKWPIVLAVAVMVVSSILQVFFRYVLDSPLGWTEEVSRFLMLWWTFLCVGVLAYQRKLLGIDALLLAVSARTGRTMVAFAHAFCVGVSLWLVYLGYRLVLLGANQPTPAIEIPYGIVYAAFPVGMGVAALGFIVCLIFDIKDLLSGDPTPPVKVSERSDL